jgi:hypothetical protein
MSRDALADLSANVRVSMWICSFCGIDRIRERFNFGRRMALQLSLSFLWQTESEPNA